MPKLSDAIQSRYLRKEDFPKPRVLTITTAELQNVAPVGEKEEKKYCLYFREEEKPLVLNTTMNLWLQERFGDEIENLVDQKVCVFTDASVMYAGKRVGGLRLREAPKTGGRFADLPDDDETLQIPGA
jgi:hypothetical protein